ncbi:hypothetical protein B0T19DRAFT_234977 [Cercophora scortea]|uniref:Uncharacterized protein n=1 Tax=Cercophora scortea TaxID=314031 RepID=A0AAE0MA64_9PEZI|nr:hypothetical protein B0T19DRAFT_234977 [Cercophora scortea]
MRQAGPIHSPFLLLFHPAFYATFLPVFLPLRLGAALPPCPQIYCASMYAIHPTLPYISSLSQKSGSKGPQTRLARNGRWIISTLTATTTTRSARPATNLPVVTRLDNQTQSLLTQKLSRCRPQRSGRLLVAKALDIRRSMERADRYAFLARFAKTSQTANRMSSKVSRLLHAPQEVRGVLALCHTLPAHQDPLPASPAVSCILSLAPRPLPTRPAPGPGSDSKARFDCALSAASH